VGGDVDKVKGAPGASGGQLDRRRVSIWSRVHLWALAELFALSGFVIAQPVLEVTGKSPDFFLFRRADRLDLLLLVAGLTVLPALCVWLAEVLIGLVNNTIRRHLHTVAMTGLFMLLALEVVKKTTDLRGPRLTVIASVGGVLGGVLYARRSWLRLWLRWLTPAPLAFALLFLLVSPTSALVLPARAGAIPDPLPVTASGKRPPLVMILFDEFPLSSLLDSKGRIDRRVYPNIAALADQSTWYRNATGVAGYTPWALPAMLTGNYPAEVKAPSHTEYPDNLFTLFGRYYNVKAYETISQLCPPSQCPPSAGDFGQTGLRAVAEDSARVLKRIVQPYDTDFDQKVFIDQDAREARTIQAKEWGAAQFRFKRMQLNQPRRFNDFLNSLEPSNRPTLHFLHLLLPHIPWRYLPSGNVYNFESFDLADNGGQVTVRRSELGHQEHLLQVAYVDRLVGQLMAKLKTEGMWDKSMVVMGADHGEGWTSGEQSRMLGQRNAPNLMWVPQLIKAPRQKVGAVDDRNWEQVDLLPTVAELAGIRVPWKTEGSSQTGRPTRERREKWWYDIPGRRKVLDGPSNWKVVLAGETDTLVRGSEGVRGLYRFGAFADLVYRDPASVGRVGGDPATATLNDDDLYDRIELTSGTVPALVSGRFAAPPPPGAAVLVAVNGRIGGGSQLYPERPGEPADSFAVITPDFLYRTGDGHRQLQVYLLERRGGDRPQLRPVTLSAQ
jgi:Sulfatase